MKKHTSMPKFLLRIEGLVLFIIATVLYFRFDGGMAMYFILFLFPDLAFIAYAINSKIGSIVYNIMHTYLLPGLLVLFGLAYGMIFLYIALIWFAHIGIDRALGLGLKYPNKFKNTHFTKV